MPARLPYLKHGVVILLSAAVIILSAGCFGDEAPVPRSAQGILQQAVTEAGIPGIGAVVTNGGGIVEVAAAEAASGEAWDALIEKHIFEQFGMTKSGFGWVGKGGEDVPWGHTMRDGALHPVDPNGDYQLPQYLAPAGDIHASLPDMARFFQGILLSWHEKDSYLDRDTLQQMLTRRLGSGLGWGAREAFGYDPVAIYSGSADTFLMVVVLIPDADLGFAVAANAYSDDIERAVVQALRSIVRLYITDKDQQ